MRPSPVFIAALGSCLLFGGACGGGSSAAAPEQSAPATTPATVEHAPGYAEHFVPVSQDVGKPARLLAAFRSNYLRSLAAWSVGNAGLSRRYLLFIVGTDNATGAPYSLLCNRVPVDAAERVGPSGGFRAYLEKYAPTYTVQKTLATSPRRVALEVVEHAPATPGQEVKVDTDTDFTLAFVRRSSAVDRYGARFVLTQAQPH